MDLEALSWKSEMDWESWEEVKNWKTLVLALIGWETPWEFRFGTLVLL